MLLAEVKALELLAGRRPGPRHGPRPLDIDLLVHGDLVRTSPELTLPHPELRRRAFVLLPLAEVAPALRVPPDGARAAELAAALGPAPEIERLAWRSLTAG